MQGEKCETKCIIAHRSMMENTVHVKSLITEKIALKIYTCNWIYCFFVKNIRDILTYPKIL